VYYVPSMFTNIKIHPQIMEEKTKKYRGKMLTRTSPKMYRYLPRYGKSENENMQNYALNVVNLVLIYQKY